jgi:hypothetical protein
MVVINANRAEGSFLGFGTHVWLEITNHLGEKITFSGARRGKFLHVIKNYKRDIERSPELGLLEISPPHGVSSQDWDERVISAALEILEEMHMVHIFNGVWPWGNSRSGLPRSNCCRVVKNIIDRAGGEIPNGRIKGVLPGLGRGWRDYL